MIYFVRRLPDRLCVAIVLATLLFRAYGVSAEGSARPRKDKEEFWRLATVALGQMVAGDLVAAVYTLKEAKSIRSDPDLDTLVGLAALAGGDANAAKKHFYRVIQRGQISWRTYYWAGRAELYGGRKRQAYRRFLEAVEVGGERSSVRMAQALVAASLGWPARATAALKRVAELEMNLLDPRLYPTALQGAIEIFPDLLRGFKDLNQIIRTQGHLYWRINQVLAAESCFEALQDRSPNDADAMRMRAEISWVFGKKSDALRRAQRAVLLAPHLLVARSTYGELLLRLGHARKAARELLVAADKEPHNAARLVRLARAYRLSGEAKKALRFLGYAFRRGVKDPSAVIEFGLALLRNGELKRAEQVLKKAHLLTPLDPRIYAALAQISDLNGDKKAARRAQRRHRRLKRRQTRMHRRRRKVFETIYALKDTVTACNRTLTECDGALEALMSAQIPRAIVAFIRAHIALKRKTTSAAMQWLRIALGGVNPAVILLRDPTQRASAVSIPVAYGDDPSADGDDPIKGLPMVDPAYFARVTWKTSSE